MTFQFDEDVAVMGASFFELSGTSWDEQGRLVAMIGQLRLIQMQ